MTKLTVIVITKNEAHNIEDCLSSVSFSDEIIVFDSSSTDNTVALCHKYTPLVTVTSDWPGDGPQKNRALAQATGEWVLCLDADERLTAALMQEIQTLINTPTLPHQAYAIPYRSTYLGKLIRHGDWAKESHVRLFKRDSAAFTMHRVHCRLEVNGTVGKLKSYIIHHPFPNLDGLLHKLNDYSTQSAILHFNKGRKATMWTALSHGLWTFLRGYLLKMGFLDGREGFLLAVSNAQGTYYRYLKLMYLCQQFPQGQVKT